MSKCMDKCMHLQKVPGAWHEWRCGITGISMESDDCRKCTGSCLPWLGLQIALGTVEAENLPPVLQNVAEVAVRQAADPARLPASREREEAAVALGLSPIEQLKTRLGRRMPSVPSRRRSEAARKRWAACTPEERGAIGEAISAGRKAANARGRC